MVNELHKKELVIVDVSAVMRTHYRPLNHKFPLSINLDGEIVNTSALFGLLRLYKTWGLDKDYIFCYDTPQNFLKMTEAGKDYKKGRKKPQDDYFTQLNLSRKLLTSINEIVLSQSGYEADHFVVYAKDELSPYYDHTYIITNDKDLAVCVDEKTTWVSTRTKQPNITMANYIQELGCPYNAIRLKKALVGDPSDNIKGIYRFGEKKFKDFILTENLDHENVFGREAEIIKDTSWFDDEQKADALSDLSLIMPLEVPPQEFIFQEKDTDKLYQYLEIFQMNSIIKALYE